MHTSPKTLSTITFNLTFMLLLALGLSACGDDAQNQDQNTDLSKIESSIELTSGFSSQIGGDFSSTEVDRLDEEECYVGEPIIVGEPGYCYFDCLGYCEGRLNAHPP